MAFYVNYSANFRIHSEPVDFMDGRGAELFGYCVYGVACSEVEVDCLTGDHHVCYIWEFINRKLVFYADHEELRQHLVYGMERLTNFNLILQIEHHFDIKFYCELVLSKYAFQSPISDFTLI